MRRHIALLTVLVILFGGSQAWHSINRAEEAYRRNLRARTEMTAAGINLARIHHRTSSSPVHEAGAVQQRLEDQLARTMAQIQDCRRLRLQVPGERESLESLVDCRLDTLSSREDPLDAITLEALRAGETQLAEPGSFSGNPHFLVSVPLKNSDGDKVLAVLGAEFQATERQAIHWPSSRSPIVIVVLTVLMLIMLEMRFRRHAETTSGAGGKTRGRDIAATIIVIGLFLTAMGTWVNHRKQVQNNARAFDLLAAGKMDAVAKTLYGLRDVEMESLAHLYEASEYVSPAEFREYADFLLEDPAIHAWREIRFVEQAGLPDLEAQARREGLGDYSVWEWDPNGKRVPASPRNPHFPVFRAASRTECPQNLGLDLASVPECATALSEALRTGLPTASAPLPRTWKNGLGQNALLVFRPIFTPGEDPRPRVLACAELGMHDLLESGHPSDQVALGLGLHLPDGGLSILASSDGLDPDQCQGPALRLPLFAFGEVFCLRAQPGPSFPSPHNPSMGWIVALTGAALSLLAGALAGQLLDRRRQLEILVEERTAELVEAKQSADLAIQGADLGAWDLDLRKNMVVFNDHALRMLGLPPDRHQLTLEEWEARLHTEDLAAAQDRFRKHVEGGVTVFEAELRLGPCEGQWVWSLSRGRIMEHAPDGNPLRVCGTFLNISHRKEAEAERLALQDQLMQVRKLEAVGRLAGGVAHDLNNMLAPVIGYAEMLQEDLEEEPHGPCVNGILQAGYRARDLIRQLLAFSRRQPMVFEALDINQVISDFTDLLRRTIPEDIEFFFEMKPDLPAVRGDAGQLEQVIMNLAVNAADAMPDGGSLTIETALVDLDQDYAASHPDVNPGPHVQIVISDTGMGMDEETRDCIFEPFFTRGKSQGTGLGLATVFGIVKQHRGNIWVYSEPGRGTTFKVYLPATEDPPLPRTPQPSAASRPTGTETILVVEDNDDVRHMAVQVLERAGFQVLQANDGESALDMLAGEAPSLDLLLTDVVLPGMNGRDLHGQVQTLQPDTKVIFMSGYTDNVIAHRGVLDEGIHFIEKPFNVRALVKLIRKVLDGSR